MNISDLKNYKKTITAPLSEVLEMAFFVGSLYEAAENNIIDIKGKMCRKPVPALHQYWFSRNLDILESQFKSEEYLKASNAIKESLLAINDKYHEFANKVTSEDGQEVATINPQTGLMILADESKQKEYEQELVDYNLPEKMRSLQQGIVVTFDIYQLYESEFNKMPTLSMTAITDAQKNGQERPHKVNLELGFDTFIIPKSTKNGK